MPLDVIVSLPFFLPSQHINQYGEQVVFILLGYHIDHFRQQMQQQTRILSPKPLLLCAGHNISHERLLDHLPLLLFNNQYQVEQPALHQGGALIPVFIQIFKTTINYVLFILCGYLFPRLLLQQNVLHDQN